VIGCAIARLLAAQGLETLLLDRGVREQTASWAAAGMLSPLAEAHEPSAFLDLLRASARLFPALAAELRGETGIDVEHRTEGTLLVALSERDEDELDTRYRWQSDAGLPVERLSGAEAQTLEPGLSPAVRWALRFTDDHQVDSRKLTEALTRSAVRSGASIRQAEVQSLVLQGDRAAGVELRSGEMIHAGCVIVAAGCWSGQLAGLPRALPVRPVHGQLLALQAAPGLISHIVDSPRVYLVPRHDGRVIVGTTTEDLGYTHRLSDVVSERLRAAAAEAVPALADADLVESWSGLRPGTPDGSPILGPDPEIANLIYATGHYRNGILLAPLTAQLIAGQLSGADQEISLAPFSVSRFN